MTVDDATADAQTEVQNTKHKGSCLFTRKSRQYGDLIYEESPLSFSPGDTDSIASLQKFLDSISATELQANWYVAALLSLRNLSGPDLQFLLSKWTPEIQSDQVETSIIQFLKDTLTARHSAQQDTHDQMDRQMDEQRHDHGTAVTDHTTSDCEDMEFLKSLTPELLRKAVLVWRYNSFAHHSNDTSLIMYNRTSFMSHSCKPSAAWSFGDTDKFCLRAIQQMEEQDELSISYLSEDQLFQPTCMRKELLRMWLFECGCERCSQIVDPLRVLSCPSCISGKLQVIEEGGVVRLKACDHCLYQTDDTETKRLFNIESDYFDRVNSINPYDYNDLVSVYTHAIETFNQFHWVIFKLRSLILPNLKVADRAYALSFMQYRIQYLENIGFPTYSLSWAYEELADFMLDGLGGQLRKEESILLLEKAYWVMHTITGPSSGYTIAIYEKWNSTKQ